jgi:hypothetical protein
MVFLFPNSNSNNRILIAGADGNIGPCFGFGDKRDWGNGKNTITCTSDAFSRNLYNGIMDRSAWHNAMLPAMAQACHQRAKTSNVQALKKQH